MARNLKVGEWVQSKADGMVGFIESNEGNGFWIVQFTKPVQMRDYVRSSQLDRMDNLIVGKQAEEIKNLYTNLALSTRDYEWLENLAAGNILSSDI
ncbi:hypothetical protein [Priestia megaterium]|uniref:hypothetical protein n=1 Tax=Priestia megaterium TaxID=1404 RepID=UPI00211C8E7F|nr:hypothetical protein [Priestia megaterium]